MNVRIITLWQPWATLLALGVKQNETRPAAAKYSHQDPVLIHAAVSTPKSAFESMTWENRELIVMALEEAGYRLRDLPRGAIVGEFKVKEFATVRYIADQGFRYNPVLSNGLVLEEGMEEALGNYSPGRSIWLGTDHRQLAEPVPYKNGQGYYQKFKGDYNQLQFKL